MASRLIVRMTAPVVVTSLLLLVVGVGAAWYVHQLQHRVSDELTANVSSLRAAEELLIALQKIRAQLENYQLTQDRSYLRAIPPLEADTERWLAEAERWGNSADERQMMSQVRRGQQRFFGEVNRLLAEPPGALQGKVKLLVDDVLNREMLSPTQAYLIQNARESKESMNENEKFASRLVYVLLLLGICGSGAGLLAGIAFARAFQRSLVQLSLPIRAAAGHLEEAVGPVTFSANADLHEMESMLRLIADRIGAIVERLQQSEREVLRAEQLAAVGQMAAGMAHELRNPLTSMKILVQAASTAERGDPTPDGAGLRGRDLAVLEEEITRLERLVHSFLQFAQPPQLEKRVVDLRRIVEDTLKLVAHRAEMCRTRIDTTFPETPVDAAVDVAQVRQVLLNLLLNALDAIGSGGGIRVELAKGVDGWITLNVADTGCGLPAGLGQRIFSPFITTKETGLGLGLSICKRIIEAHGGEIAGSNRPEGGAVFAIRLPPARN